MWKKLNPMKNKLVHYAMEYPCSHCGYIECLCDEAGIKNEEVNWTEDETKVTCKICKKELRKLNK